MEFRSEDLAKLVLGYLKDQKCHKAFLHFLNSSVHLKEYAMIYKKGKYIVTRVGGLTLTDYLLEYAAIYSIVQEQLEDTDYYKENDSRTSLVHQISFLLSHKSSIESRINTPLSHSSIIGNSAEDYGIADTILVNNQVSDIDSNTKKERALVEHLLGDNSCLDVSEDGTSTQKHDKSTNTDDEVNEKSQECAEIFTQSFLENTELVERLADNINKEVSGSEDLAIRHALSNTAIDSIIHRMSNDPMVANLIEEIIDEDKSYCRNSVSDQSPNKYKCKENESNDLNADGGLEPIKKRLRNSSKTPSPFTDRSQTSIEEQNDAAIESIVAAALSSEIDIDVQDTRMIKNNIQTISSNEMVTSSGVCGQLYNNDIISTPCAQNPIFINTSTPNPPSLVMFQQSGITSYPKIIQTKNLQVDSTKPCYLIGNQPLINVNIPQAPLKLNTVLTEQDIMAMPTIIVCDNNQKPVSDPSVTLPVTPATTSAQSTSSRFCSIAPKQVKETVQTIGEYITLYQCNEPYSPVISQPVSNVSPPSKLMVSKGIKRVKETPQKSVLEPIQIQIAELDPYENMIHQRSAENGPQQTAHLVKIVDRKNQTPRSDSHVRQLDFSTPKEWSSLLQQTPVLQDAKENLLKVCKNNTKTARTTLFKLPETEANCDGNTNVKKSNCWDADLRALATASVAAANETASAVVSSKRKIPDSSKDAPLPKKAKENLTEIEAEAKRIEMALIESSPSKTNTPVGSVNKPSTSKSTKFKKQDKNRRKKKKVCPLKKTISDGNTEGSAGVVNTNNSNISEKELDKVKLPDKQTYLKTCNTKSKIRKKCNMENSPHKRSTLEEVVLTNITKIKSCEVLDAGKNKLILSSPSKLNANKRELIETESNSSKCPLEKEHENDEKKITMEKPIAMPILETPVKTKDTILIKTPGCSATKVVDTPFTKAVIEQLSNVDINTIPTPTFPVTPSFPLTPGNGLQPTSLSTRTTDYSNSSSYYQPSDTEKCFEQFKEEYLELQKQPHLQDINLDEKRDELPPAKKESFGLSTTSDDAGSSIRDKTNAFNENMMGKKNLHLVKMLSKDTVKSDSSDESNSENEASISSGVDTDSSSSSSSVVESSVATKSASLPYMLRSRKPIVKSSKTKVSVSEPEKPKAKSFQSVLLNEIEEKRQRTIAMLKADSTAKPKAISKPKHKAPAKTNPRKRITKKNTEIRKSVLNKSNCNKSEAKKGDCKRKLSNVTESVDKEVMIHLNSDDESIRPFEMVETELLDCSPTLIDSRENNRASSKLNEKGESDGAVDPEAELLVNGLMQWGIHLVPNKANKNVSQQDRKSNDDDKLEANKSKPKIVSKETKIDKSEEDVDTCKLSNTERKEEINSKKPNNSSGLLFKLLSRENAGKKSLKVCRKSSVSKSRRKSDSAKQTEKSDKLRNRSKSETKTLDNTAVPLLALSRPSLKILPNESTVVQETSLEALSSSMDSDLQFEIKTYTEETFKVVHDYSKKTERNIADYDFSILKKKFAANVYIAEIDEEIENFLNVTPFEFLLDIPSEKQKKVKLKPLTVLYNQLVKIPATTDMSTHSPIQDLYESETPPSRNLKGGKKRARKDSTTVNQPCQEIKIDEDLMDYAVIGNVQVENDVDVEKWTCPDSESEQREKKQETQELLKNVDVDKFLKTVHGDT